MVDIYGHLQDDLRNRHIISTRVWLLQIVFQDGHHRIFHSTHFSYNDMLTPFPLIDGVYSVPLKLGMLVTMKKMLWNFQGLGWCSWIQASMMWGSSEHMKRPWVSVLLDNTSWGPGWQSTSPTKHVSEDAFKMPVALATTHLPPAWKIPSKNHER